MKYLRYKVEMGDTDTEAVILAVLRAPRQGGLASAELVARARVERDLARSMEAIRGGGPHVIAFEDERASALQKAVAAHVWGAYALPFAEFIEAVESMPSEPPKE